MQFSLMLIYNGGIHLSFAESNQKKILSSCTAKNCWSKTEFPKLFFLRSPLKKLKKLRPHAKRLLKKLQLKKRKNFFSLFICNSGTSNVNLKLWPHVPSLASLLLMTHCNCHGSHSSFSKFIKITQILYYKTLWKRTSILIYIIV